MITSGNKPQSCIMVVEDFHQNEVLLYVVAEEMVVCNIATRKIGEILHVF
jgi:hypothetical protein